MGNAILRRSRAVLLLLAVCGVVTGAAASEPNGLWVLNLGPRTLLILSITAPPDSGRSVSGWLSRPSNFQTDGWSFTQVARQVRTGPIVASSWNGAVLSITVQNPANPSDPANASDKDTLLLTLRDETHAQLRMAGQSLPPFDLIRAHGTPSIATDWDQAKTYSPDDGAISNPEMKRIFEEDQRVRPAGFKIDWASVNKSDAVRRAATRKLLREDALAHRRGFHLGGIRISARLRPERLFVGSHAGYHRPEERIWEGKLDRCRYFGSLLAKRAPASDLRYAIPDAGRPAGHTGALRSKPRFRYCPPPAGCSHPIRTRRTAKAV